MKLYIKIYIYTQHTLEFIKNVILKAGREAKVRGGKKADVSSTY